MEDLYEFFKKSMEVTKIYADNRGVRIEGDVPSVLTMLTKIFSALKEEGVKKEFIQEALDMAFMNEKELDKKLLNQTKELLEKIKNDIENESEE